MSEEVREFLVVHAVTGESNELTVVGRAGGLPIPERTVFTVAYQEKKAERGEEFSEHPPREHQKSVRLEVVQVSAYGRVHAELPPYATGSLTFRESDLSLAPPGWMLSES